MVQVTTALISLLVFPTAPLLVVKVLTPSLQLVVVDEQHHHFWCSNDTFTLVVLKTPPSGGAGNDTFSAAGFPTPLFLVVTGADTATFTGD